MKKCPEDAPKMALKKLRSVKIGGKSEQKYEIGKIDQNHLCIETEHGDPRECFGSVLAWRHFGAKKKNQEKGFPQEQSWSVYSITVLTRLMTSHLKIRRPVRTRNRIRQNWKRRSGSRRYMMQPFDLNFSDEMC